MTFSEKVQILNNAWRQALLGIAHLAVSYKDCDQRLKRGRLADFRPSSAFASGERPFVFSADFNGALWRQRPKSVAMSTTRDMQVAKIWEPVDKAVPYGLQSFRVDSNRGRAVVGFVLDFWGISQQGGEVDISPQDLSEKSKILERLLLEEFPLPEIVVRRADF